MQETATRAEEERCFPPSFKLSAEQAHAEWGEASAGNEAESGLVLLGQSYVTQVT